MKTSHVYISLFIGCILLTTCKKYEDGGSVRQTMKHLCGGNKIGNSKTWDLVKYEVNGIDSTFLIAGVSNISNFPKDFVTFSYVSKGDPSPGYSAKTALYEYQGKFGKADKYLTLGYGIEPYSHNDSAQCKTIDNLLVCSRNIFFPEFNNYGKIWNIKKLTKKECVLTSEFQLKNKYKIILSKKQ